MNNKIFILIIDVHRVVGVDEHIAEFLRLAMRNQLSKIENQP